MNFRGISVLLTFEKIFGEILLDSFQWGLRSRIGFGNKIFTYFKIIG